MNSRNGLLLAAVVAVLFLGASYVPRAAPALFQLTCCKQQTVAECYERYFYDVMEFTETDRNNLFAALDAADWVGLDGDNAADCLKVLNAVNKLYYGSGADLYTGMPDWEAQQAAGDSGLAIAGYLPHPNGPAVLFHFGDTRMPRDVLAQALHEAAHSADIGHDDEFSSCEAQECAEIPPPPPDDDDPPGSGGGAAGALALRIPMVIRYSGRTFPATTCSTRLAEIRIA